MKQKTAIIFLIIILLVPFPILAGNDDKTETVIVTGIGIDADKARQNAIRNAVEQVIGSYISSDTIVQNSQIIKDEVLSFSGGYVKESRAISVEKNAEGLTVMKLEALVVSTKLKRKIASLNIATEKIEGESLFGEAYSKIVLKQSAEKILIQTLRKYPQSAYTFEVRKPVIENTHHKESLAHIKIPLIIKWDVEYLRELNEILTHISKDGFREAYLASFETDKIAKVCNMICFSNQTSIKSGTAKICYCLDKAIPPKYNGFLLAPEHKLLDIKHILSLSIIFKNSHGQDILAKRFPFINSDFYRHGQDILTRRSAFIPDDNYDTDGIRGLAECGGSFNLCPPGVLWNDRVHGHFLIVEDAAFHIDLQMSVDINILKDITKIEASFNDWANSVQANGDILR
jgi:hypothetical protein